MQNQETPGQRIRARRKILKLTQQQLAADVGVSHVAISQWEKNETLPRGEHLLRLAELLQCPAAWLFDGEGEPFAVVSSHSSVRAVPLLTLQQVTGWLDETRLQLQREADRFLYCDNAVSDSAVAVQLNDHSMQPAFLPGDLLIFEPQRSAAPGEVVLALYAGQALVRMLRVHSPSQNEEHFLLRPVNEDYPVLRTDRHEVQIIGVLAEQRRRYRADDR
ncbi:MULTISPECIES: helix-turn-helix domain-containing protein [Pantoea]|uniref:helix-turn-helix domain-containing protein n=1 Tax=Pantoea TaxID=53335 RepID=UPI00080F4002|nr:MULTISPECIES: helix-turn-helix domain-containing protein [Pantoea]